MNINFIYKTFASLKHENFKQFFIGQTISLIGSWMQITALSWLVYDMTGSKLLLGLVGALSALPMLFLSVLGGVFADKYSKKKILIATQISSMLLSFVLAVLVVSNVIQIWHIIALASISGIIFAIDLPVRQSFYIDIVGKKDLMNAIALNSSMVNMARIIGPALAGIIMAKFGIVWCFILNTISYAAVLQALFKIKLPQIQVRQNIESVVQYIGSGFRYVRNNRLIFDLLVLMVIVGIFGWSYGILFPVMAKDIFHVGERGYAALVSANGIGALFGALFIAYLGDSPQKRGLVNLGIYILSLSIMLLALCKTYWMGLILVALAGFGSLVYFNATTTIIQSSVDDSVRGRVMGIWSLIFGGTAPIGNIYVGAAAEYIKIPATLAISAIVCTLAAIVLSIFLQPKETEASEMTEIPDMQKEAAKV
ncbi:MAG: hypothetical protein A2287_00445 [Candidatus Melainabacteria bacterium RIFOXYA12_FULL_32_12]|nr:MAG: hypothetical protein A2255_03310 [Candidatus Melainabacteria bacterium RIFOXYA2_FULL_32_9]OGI31365.1 MAG: hypothetical protein A2287_00445 [Candidatus Melainabacteria bacterium RIFOXYA12_FULL_32_12]